MVHSGKLALMHLGLRPTSLEAGLARAAKAEIPVRSIVDIGASNGSWSRWARRYFPSAKCLLVEPLEEHRPTLERMKAEYPGLEFCIAVAGQEPGTVTFNVTPDLDGSGVYGGGAGARSVPCITVDDEVEKRGLIGPFLLKLDTHGYELPILAGARNTLRQCSLVVIEVYVFKVSPTAICFNEMVTHMENLGFKVWDLIEPVWRDRDSCLWQFDLIFRPATDPVFAQGW
jgi:FkbM family methyltransferase